MRERPAIPAEWELLAVLPRYPLVFAMRVLLPLALILACGVASCAKPDHQVLADCHSQAAQKGKHHGLTSKDLGELTEACMATKGYLLNKNGEDCTHDLPSQNANRCYYLDTWWARAYHRFI